MSNPRTSITGANSAAAIARARLKEAVAQKIGRDLNSVFEHACRATTGHGLYSIRGTGQAFTLSRVEVALISEVVTELFRELVADHQKASKKK